VPETREIQSAHEIPVYSDVRIPEGDGRRPLLIGLHGYGGEKGGMMRALARIGGDALALASVQGPYPHIAGPRDPGKPLGYGFGWITSFRPDDAIAIHHAALDRLIERLVADHGVDPGRIFLLGFSQSVAINFRYAFTRPERLRGVVGICGGIPGDWDRDDKYRTAGFDVLYLGGSRDDYYPPDRVRENGRALSRRAGHVETEIIDAGHEISPAALARVGGWLDPKL